MRAAQQVRPLCVCHAHVRPIMGITVAIEVYVTNPRGDFIMDTAPILFSPPSSTACAQRVASALGVALAEHEWRPFEDGEHKMLPLESVRGGDVYVVHSLYGEPGHTVNDKLCELLFFVGALVDASAARVSVVAPYLCAQGSPIAVTRSRDYPPYCAALRSRWRIALCHARYPQSGGISEPVPCARGASRGERNSRAVVCVAPARYRTRVRVHGLQQRALPSRLARGSGRRPNEDDP